MLDMPPSTAAAAATVTILVISTVVILFRRRQNKGAAPDDSNHKFSDKYAFNGNKAGNNKVGVRALSPRLASLARFVPLICRAARRRSSRRRSR